jgi:hypothetical protein
VLKCHGLICLRFSAADLEHGPFVVEVPIS